MKLIIAAILIFSSGYFTGNYLFSKIFDPMRFLQEANFLAGESYLNGCLTAKQSKEGEIPSAEDRKECHDRAANYFIKLEALREQNP